MSGRSLQQLAKLIAADVRILQQPCKRPDRHCPFSHRYAQCSTSSYVDVNMVATAAPVVLPALAFQDPNELLGSETRELVAHAAGATLRCSTLGSFQPCSWRDSR
jgi:hypothetical protein